MRKILLLLWIPCFAFGQQKGDNEIIVKNASVRQAADALLDAGFVIDKYDTSLGYISTQIKPIGKHNVSMKIIVRIKEGTAFFTGQYRIGVGQYALVPGYFNRAGSYPVVYYNSGYGNSKACWNIIKAIALKINNNLEYSKLN